MVLQGRKPNALPQKQRTALERGSVLLSPKAVGDMTPSLARCTAVPPSSTGRPSQTAGRRLPDLPRQPSQGGLHGRRADALPLTMEKSSREAVTHSHRTSHRTGETGMDADEPQIHFVQTRGRQVPRSAATEDPLSPTGGRGGKSSMNVDINIVQCKGNSHQGCVPAGRDWRTARVRHRKEGAHKYRS